ncbi:MAG: tetratricopeptide repeat protein [Deltaproteobacteria bacterium]|nr:tetratricopeptide repeat protein [Deltaproteobacteria bacterium]MCX7953064.1 tetratricopeptide repeat protein [Deltaproteobacteria bacterium]
MKWDLVVFLTFSVLLVSCSTFQKAYEEFQSKSDTTKGAIVGGTVGSVVGTALGSQVGNPVEGFAIGAAAGAGVGAMIGSAIEKEKETAERKIMEKQIASLETTRMDYLTSDELPDYSRYSMREKVAPSDRFYSRLRGVSQTTSPSMKGADHRNSSSLEPKTSPETESVGIQSSKGRDITNLNQNLKSSYRDKDVPTEPRSSVSLLEHNPHLKHERETPSKKDGLGQSDPNSAINPSKEVTHQTQESRLENIEKMETSVKDQSAATEKSLWVENSHQCPEGVEELKKAEQSNELSTKLFHTRRAVRVCDGFVPARLALAKLYLDLKRNEDAQFELENILSLDPSNKEAKNLLEKLKSQN